MLLIFLGKKNKIANILAKTASHTTGTTELHRQNLIKQALEQHRQAEQQAKDRAEQQAEKLDKDEQEQH